MQKLKILKNFTFWLVTCLVALLGYAYSYATAALAQSLNKCENRRVREPVKSVYFVKSMEASPLFESLENKTELARLQAGEYFMVIKIYRDWAYGHTEQGQAGYTAKKNLTLLTHE